MDSHVLYRIVRNAENVIVAAASAETCRRHHNAEMTDFATLPSERGLGLAQHLLSALEDDMREWSLPNLYTIARARSAGMNRVFYNRGYSRTGTLVNNCHIAGHFEDMHVWCKTLEPAVQN
jgi:putative beta-lysine N-acetyltransferase